MAFQKRSLLTYLGFVIWGDLAELTMYRDRYRRVVVYPKQYPRGPLSDRTIELRATFKAAATRWGTLNAAKQDQWNKACARASLPMSGYNLYLSQRLAPDDRAIETLERQTDTELISD